MDEHAPGLKPLVLWFGFRGLKAPAFSVSRFA
ncbi:hypothetical protein Terro_0439 [Terriglobus roseus DSM 18391]|uniref:Uncharacterized protein n=1 Tax=Terriglobus roseus (strain DSM 18391 / NRRL B-41598 / KBS 63) TaxID=926566 RepID=I3ZC15_TERRK|nr:hypothetical protein Terro_0439 [Terriglobus roseus DSM 18391]